MINLLKKYEVFIKYIFSAGISFAIDIVLFTIFSKGLGLFLGSIAIIIATVLARIISSLINYFLNKNKVFNHGNGALDKGTLIKYYLLVIVQMGVSAFSVWFIHNIINIEATFIKIIVDIIIFIVNYFVQKYFIFKK